MANRVPEKCPDCHSKNIVKAGFKVTRQGKFQRLQCQFCGRSFYPNGDIAK